MVDIDHALINPKNFYDNIYVGKPAQARVGETSWTEWRKFGGDKGSAVVSDPGFVNPAERQLLAKAECLRDWPWLQGPSVGKDGPGPWNW